MAADKSSDSSQFGGPRTEGKSSVSQYPKDTYPTADGTRPSIERKSTGDWAVAMVNPFRKGFSSNHLTGPDPVEKDDGPPPKSGGMFVDAAAMKEKMRQQLSKPDYNVANFYHPDGFFQAVARSAAFERVTLGVIGVNAIWISIDADHNTADTLNDADPIFQAADHFFCTFFVLEWFIRLMAFKRKQDGLRDGWFLFDMILVITMVLETWVLTIIMAFVGGASGSGINTSVLKLIRLTRLSRMARMARLLRAMPELMVLIKGMWAATRSVFFTLFLLFLILYVFGVAFKQLADGSDIGSSHFGSVPASMHTLLLRGTLMDEMTPIVEALMDEGIVVIIVFYIFVLVSALTVMNMLIGVLCEVVAAVAATEKEESSVAYVKWQIRDVMKRGGLDLDGDGMISKDEFCKILDNPMATRTLSNAGVDVFGLVDCADFIFDGEGSPFAGQTEHVQDEMGRDLGPRIDEFGELRLSFADFMEVVLQLRGNNMATVKDLVDLRKFLTVTCKKIDDKITTSLTIVERSLQVGQEMREEHHKDMTAMRSTFKSESYSSEASGKGSVLLHPDERKPILMGHEVPQPSEQMMKQASIAEEPQEIVPLEAASSERDGNDPLLAQDEAALLPNLLQLPNLDHAFSELDQLRHYVDAELAVIMQELAPGLRSRSHGALNGDAGRLPPRLYDKNGAPLGAPSHSLHSRGPGAGRELACNDFGQQELRPRPDLQSSSTMSPGGELGKKALYGL